MVTANRFSNDYTLSAVHLRKQVWGLYKQLNIDNIDSISIEYLDQIGNGPGEKPKLLISSCGKKMVGKN